MPRRRDVIPLAAAAPDAQPAALAEQRPAAEAAPLPERLLWDLPEAAHALNISPRTLKRMSASGELPEGAVVHLSRRRLFGRKALEAWIAQGCPAVARGKRRSAR